MSQEERSRTEERKKDPEKAAPRTSAEQGSPEQVRPTTPAEDAGQAPHQVEDPPQAEGKRGTGEG